MQRAKRPATMLQPALEEIFKQGILGDYFNAWTGVFELLRCVGRVADKQVDQDDLFVEYYEEYLYSCYLPDTARILVAASDQARMRKINLVVQEWNQEELKSAAIWEKTYELPVRILVYGRG